MEVTKTYIDASKPEVQKQLNQWEWNRIVGLLWYNPLCLPFRVGCDDDGRLFVAVLGGKDVPADQMELIAQGAVRRLRDCVKGATLTKVA